MLRGRPDRIYAWALVASISAPATTLMSSAAVSPARRTQTRDSATGSGGSVLDGVFTSDQAIAGEKQFLRNCDSCHSVSEHTGSRFTEKWAGTTLNELFELISNTMPENEPGSLKPEEYANIIAFFLKQTGYPDGQRELPSDVTALAKIRIEPPS